MKYSYSPAWTIARKYKQHTGDKKPGPTTYHTEQSKNKDTPTWTMGTSQRPDLTSSKGIPGPGSYNPEPKYHIVSGSKFHNHFNHSKEPLNSTTPGPGQYNPNKNKLKRTYNGYYMAGKHRKLDTSAQIPGPGSYEPFKSGLDKHGVVIGHQKRLGTYASQVPGPGTYQLQRPMSAGTAPRVVFTKQNRMKRNDVDISTLGPGQYNCDYSDFSKPEQRGYSISGKLHLKSTDMIPGPGAYTPTLVDKPNPPASSMGVKTGISKDKTNTPGPGHYLRTQYNTSLSKFGKIGNEQRRPLMEDLQTPGPGAYTVVMKTEGPKYSMHGSRDLKSSQKIPGPGQYNPKVDYVKIRPTSAKIGQSKRDQYKSRGVPGPGTYNTGGEVDGPKWGFTRGSRYNIHEEQSPGPGQYQIPTTIANQAAYVTKSTSTKLFNK